MNRFFYAVDTAFGTFTLLEEEKQLIRLYFGYTDPLNAEQFCTPLLGEASKQLCAYLAGELKNFSLPLAPKGTPFQQMCWAALRKIPYGETRTNAQQAQLIGNPRAARAVGMANHNNPLPIFIPCHRVLGADGKLTGYAGGLPLQQQLLLLEKGHLSFLKKDRQTVI